LHSNDEKISKEDIEVRNNKMKTLDDLKNSVLPVILSIKEAADVIPEKEFLFLQDKLEKCHIKLDEVETSGDEVVRNRRKSIARMVSAIFKLLDTKAKKGYIENEETTNTKDDLSEETNMITGVRETGKNNNSTTEEELDKTIHDLDNNQVQMSVFDHKVQLAIDVSDFEQDSMRLTLVNGEVVVTGKIENKRMQVRRNLPPNCVANGALSKLSCDGILFINIPRQRHIYHRINLPF